MIVLIVTTGNNQAELCGYIFEDLKVSQSQMNSCIAILKSAGY